MKKLSLLFLTACASHLQYTDRAILWSDPDDAPVPQPPKRKDTAINWEGLRDTVFRPSERFFSVDYLTEARNVNSLDEVPDSSWFVNRRRDPLSPDDQPRYVHFSREVAERGVTTPEDTPVPPFVVLKEKTDGSSMGVVVTDARGVQYQLKFDPPGYPGLITSIEVIATRLAWSAGWNVAAEMLVDVKREDLKLAPDAWTVDRYGQHRPFTAEALDELLEHVEHDGTVRAAASRWIDGAVIGWFSYLGRDKHDKNDRIDHQLRRDLRGFGVWAAWVDDVDTFDNNTLDSYVGAAGEGHVVHYQQGVGASFGRFFGKPNEYWMGSSPYFTPGAVMLSLITLGATPQPWEDAGLKRARALAMLEWPQFGFYEADHFDPRKWRPVADNAAFVRQTARDRYWGAKQVVAFDEEEVRGAIAAGKLEPTAAEHLFDVLWTRREKIARSFFSNISSLDHFSLASDDLCFEDLWITAGLGGEASYRARESSARKKPRLAVHGFCVTVPRGDGYRVVELRSRRPKQGDRAVLVHLIDRGGTRHIVGVQR